MRAVEDLIDNKGFSCPIEQAAQIDKVPEEPEPLVLDAGAFWAAVAVGVEKGEDSRTASLHLTPAMRV